MFVQLLHRHFTLTTLFVKHGELCSTIPAQRTGAAIPLNPRIACRIHWVFSVLLQGACCRLQQAAHSHSAGLRRQLLSHGPATGWEGHVTESAGACRHYSNEQGITQKSDRRRFLFCFVFAARICQQFWTYQFECIVPPCAELRTRPRPQLLAVQVQVRVKGYLEGIATLFDTAYSVECARHFDITHIVYDTF